MSAKKSDVWEHFSPIDHNIAKCKLCKQHFKRSGGTTNLMRHLKARHCSVFISTKSRTEEDPLEELVVDVTETDDHVAESPAPSPLSVASSSSVLSTTQMTTQSFRQQTMHSFSSLDQRSNNKINMGVAYFIATCGLPFNTVTKPGFKVMMRSARPGYEALGRKALVDNYMPKLYDSTRSILESAIKDAEFISFTSDMWTSDSGEPFISLTAQFIGKEKWTLHGGALSCRSFDIEHTAINIKEWFSHSLVEWGIPRSKVTSITTDNGANIRLAVQLLDLPNVQCLGHTIQTGMADVKKLDVVISVTKKTYAIQQFFATRKVFRSYTKFMQERHGITAKVLPGLCPTRWWSELPLNHAIIESIQYIREFIAAYENGSKMELLLSTSEIEFLRLYTATLDPLDELTQSMSSEAYVTASSILPIVSLMADMLTRCRSSNEEGSGSSGSSSINAVTNPEHMGEGSRNEDVQQYYPIILECIVNKLQKRYDPDNNLDARWSTPERNTARKCHQFLANCSFLDPRFKRDLKERDIESAKRHIIDELTEWRDKNPDSSHQSENDANTSKRRKGLAGIFAKLSGTVGSSTMADEDSPYDKAKREIDEYTTVPPLHKDDDPLIWWESHHPTFPGLAILAKKYLAIPATSIPSERLFSHAGHIITDTRHCLTGEHAEMQIFLKMNSKIVPIPQ